MKTSTLQIKNVTKQLIRELNDRFDQKHPDDILKGVHRFFGESVVLGTGFGPSGVFLLHRLYELKLPVQVFYIDTRILFEETYQLKEVLKKRFNLNIEAVQTNLTFEQQRWEYGDELWKRNPNQCCNLRKVIPLQNYLSDKKAWISGVRRGQSDTRKQTQVIEWDPVNEVIKINPLATWTTDKVWDYIHQHKLPYNPLHDESYPSIGCIPCTEKATPGGQDERAGRWKNSKKTECGIHLPAQDFIKGK